MGKLGHENEDTISAMEKTGGSRDLDVQKHQSGTVERSVEMDGMRMLLALRHTKFTTTMSEVVRTCY